MKKEYLKLKKSLLIATLLLNIPVLTSCNKNTTVIENENQKKTDVTSSPISSEDPIVDKEDNESIVSKVMTTLSPIVSLEPMETSQQVAQSVASKEKKTPAPIISSEPIDNNQEVTNYFNNVEKEIDELLNRINESGVKEKIYAKFIKVTDFIFCDGEINGIKFNDLTETTKQKLKDIQHKIDIKIDSKVPGYKDTLKEKYYQVKAYVENSETFNNIKDTYNETKEELKDKVDEIVGHENTVDEFWDSVEEDINDVKDMAGSTKEKIKEKYNNWSQKYRKD